MKRLLKGLLALAATGVCVHGHAGALHFCDRQANITPAQQDRLYRFAAIIKTELEKSEANVALISRSGLNLSRFHVRYSHTGISLKANENTPWSVRQLYYACDEHKPRIFDQGVAGFLLGTDDPTMGYISLVFMPEAESFALERAALDHKQVLQVLSANYSANAYPYSLQYQNCNQWVMELLAMAWGHLDETLPQREQAQQWLRHHEYEPSTIAVDSRMLMWAGAFVPFIHSDDQPPQNIADKRYVVSMPASIESFVHRVVPQASRIEFCHNDHQVVIRRGWDLIPDGCQPGEHDTVVALD